MKLVIKKEKSKNRCIERGKGRKESKLAIRKLLN